MTEKTCFNCQFYVEGFCMFENRGAKVLDETKTAENCPDFKALEKDEEVK